ncbi:MAG: hypothetical protein WCA38_17020 [Candidatus Acidiferrales bacterium]
MKTAPHQDFRFHTDRHAEASQHHGFSFLGILRITALVLALAFAPALALAQHGGGGGGGGGGSHASGGASGAHASAPSGGGSARGHAAANTPAANNTGSGGHWWNPFHGVSPDSSAGKGANAQSGGQIKSESQAHIERFAAANNTWQDPPSQTGAGTARGTQNGVRPVAVPRSAAALGSASSRRESVVASPPRVFLPHRPGYPYYPFYPYNPVYGFGWGGLGWGYGLCDPFWGCYGYGYGYGAGLGYYGGSFGSGYGADLNYDSSQDMSSSGEANPYLFAVPSTENGQQGATTSPSPYVMLYLKDGSTYAVSDYWLAGGRLHYVTSYGGENVIDESQLDLQRTVDENAKRGVDFTLRPEPNDGSVAAPANAAPSGQQGRPPQ